MDYNIIQGESGSVSYSSSPSEVYSCTLSVGITSYVDKGVYLIKIPTTSTTNSAALNINSVGSFIILNNGSSPSVPVLLYPGQLIANNWVTIIWDQSLALGQGAFVLLGGNDVDTGWQNMSGFAFMSTGIPQYRVIGKVIHFRGAAIVPLQDNSSVLIPYTGGASYVSQQFVAPYQGVSNNGVIISPYGSLTFNNIGGGVNGPVIPTAYFPDGAYTMGQIISARRILAQSDPNNAILYSAIVSPTINAQGQLSVDCLFDLEEYAALNPVGMSPLRYSTSQSIAGQIARDLRSIQYQQTSGTLFVGTTYTIATHNGSDDFTNVGATNNTPGTSFVATGTIPTTWSSLSVLTVNATLFGNTLNSPNILNPVVGSSPSQAQFVPNSGEASAPGLIHAVTMDAGSPYDLGGFGITLDGLMAFLP